MTHSYQKHIIAGVAVLGLLCGNCSILKKTSSSNEALPGTWQTTPIVVDGDSRDWPSPYPNYDSKSKVAYATSNDGKYLYLTMETGDELTQLKILKAGMIVSIDTGGRKNLEFNVNYPLENDNGNLELPQGDGKQDAAKHAEKQMRQQIKKAMDQSSQLSIDGFPNCSGAYTMSQSNPCGIKLKMKIDEYNELIWEAAIPIKALFNKDSLTSGDEGKPITVCFSVKALKPPKSGTVENANGGMNSAMGSGGTRGNGAMGNGMGRTGGAGGHGRSAPENPLAHLYNNTKTWKQFRLKTRP